MITRILIRKGDPDQQGDRITAQTVIRAAQSIPVYFHNPDGTLDHEGTAKVENGVITIYDQFEPASKEPFMVVLQAADDQGQQYATISGEWIFLDRLELALVGLPMVVSWNRFSGEALRIVYTGTQDDLHAAILEALDVTQE